MKIAGVILAGGLARRMGGGDKCLGMLGGRTLLDHVIARLAPQVEGLALNANGDATRFAPYRLPVIADTLDDHPGPLAGILAGLYWAAAAGFSDIVTVPADTPFIPSTLVTSLVQARKNAAAEIAVAASGERIHPTVGLWPVTLAARLENALRVDGMRRVTGFLDGLCVARAAFAALPHDPFFNINAPADLAAAAAMIEPNR